MAIRFIPPVFQMETSAGLPYAGGSLTFYLTGTSTPLDTYTSEALSVANSNPITLNSAGWPATSIFLNPEKKYKVVLKDSAGNEIWTVDPVSTTDLSSVAITKTGAGDPNGSVAGTAGSSGVLPTLYWSYSTQILYVCTVTGNAATSVWTALNAQTATPVVAAPQGYLTLTSQTPVITSDVTAATSVYYTPFVGNLVPIWNGSRMVPTECSELELLLSSSHTANTLYDAFILNSNGVPIIVTGPAWASSTAGSCSRGTGASTTQLTRLNGYWVNAVQMSGRNGADTGTVDANFATYVGSIFIDGSNGQVTCHRSWGQNRKWGVWNAYNRQPLYLKAGDSTASWSYNTNTIRASNNASANSLTVFCGLAEEWFDIVFRQRVTGNEDNPNTVVADNGIGWNSTTAMSGTRGLVGITAEGTLNAVYGNAVAEHYQAPTLGINVVTSLELVSDVSASSPTVSYFGTEANMLLSAKWRG